jgi:hypothetical protein
MDEKYTVQASFQTKQLVSGGSLIDVLHVDVMTQDGFPLFVDVPVGQATPDKVDAAIQDKIGKLRAIMNLGK